MFDDGRWNKPEAFASAARLCNFFKFKFEFIDANCANVV